MKAIAIAGPKAAGKSTLADSLEASGRFKVVPAITTRAARADDRPGQYQHLTAKKFAELRASGKLLVSDQHGSDNYGIKVADFESIAKGDRVPVLVLTPATALELAKPSSDLAAPHVMTVFVDAPDAELDERLKSRDAKVDLVKAREQRLADRADSARFTYNLQSRRGTSLSPLVEALWAESGRGGLLTARLAKPLIDAGTLLRNADASQVKAASYDLRLGDEYFQHGQIHRLDDKTQFLVIEPYDYAIVTTREECHFPNDVSGRFDLSVSMFAQGVVLSNSTQIDPGFRGPVFCLLFNTSSSKILMKRNHHFSTLEMHKLPEPVAPYKDKYQSKTLLTYLPANAAQGALNELKKEVDELKKQNRQLLNWTYVLLGIFVAVVTFVVSLK